VELEFGSAARSEEMRESWRPGFRVNVNASVTVTSRAKHQWTQPLQRLALTVFIATTACAAHAAEGGLQLLPDPTILVALLIAFAVIVFPVNALLFKPVIRALDERDERISGTRAKAERLSAEAQQVLERYEGAIRDAREQAEAARRSKLDEARAAMLETTAAARSSAEAELERARTELGSTVAGARETLRGQASDLAREAAAQVLGRPL
jgi:F-type H+-transporting ATPase subunit b